MGLVRSGKELQGNLCGCTEMSRGSWEGSGRKRQITEDLGNHDKDSDFILTPVENQSSIITHGKKKKK